MCILSQQAQIHPLATSLGTPIQVFNAYIDFTAILRMNFSDGQVLYLMTEFIHPCAKHDQCFCISVFQQSVIILDKF